MKEKLKFVGGVLPQSPAAKKRAKRNFAGDYTSCDSGAAPMDLNHPVYEDESFDTPISSRHPAGIKAAKDKGKVTSSQAAPPDPAPSPIPSVTTAPTLAAGHAYTELVASSDYRTLLDTHNVLRQTDDPAQITYLQDMIDGLRRKLGML